MGHSIVYCDKCGQLLREEDFRVGKAFTSDNRSYCANCRPLELSSSVPGAPGSKISSTRIPKQAPPESVSSTRLPKQVGQESRRIPIQPAAAPPPVPETGTSNSRLMVIGIAGAILGIGAILALFSG